MAKPDVKKYGQFCLSWEGGFCNDPDDRGGATNKGVTIAEWNAYCKKKGIQGGVATLKKITDEQYYEILKSNYLDKIKFDQIECEWIAYLLADAAYNSGVGIIKRFQLIFGLTADGIIGPKTLMAWNGGNNHQETFAKMWKERERQYIAISKLRNNAKFLKGWLRRLNGIQFGKLVCNGGKEIK